MRLEAAAAPAPATDADGDGLPMRSRRRSDEPEREGYGRGRVAGRWEYKGYGSNPLVVDTDGDGVTDGCEVASINGDTTVNSGDQGMLAAEVRRVSNGVPFATQLAGLDLNKDGTTNSGDQCIQDSDALPGKAWQCRRGHDTGLLYQFDPRRTARLPGSDSKTRYCPRLKLHRDVRCRSDLNRPGVRPSDRRAAEAGIEIDHTANIDTRETMARKSALVGMLVCLSMFSMGRGRVRVDGGVRGVGLPPSTPGVQASCTLAPGTTTVDVDVAFVNDSAGPKSLLAFNFEALSDSTKLLPIAGVDSDLNDNPDFQITPVGNWSCVRVTTSDPTSMLVAACFASTTAKVVESGTTLVLARLHYSVASASASSIRIDLVNLFDLSLSDIGSCAPSMTTPIDCGSRANLTFAAPCASDADCDGFLNAPATAQVGPANTDSAHDNCPTTPNAAQTNTSGNFVSNHPVYLTDEQDRAYVGSVW